MKLFQSLFSSSSRQKSFNGSALSMTDFSNPVTFNHSSRLNDAGTKNNSFSPKKIQKFFKRSPLLPIILVIIIVAAIAFFAVNHVMGNQQGITQTGGVLGGDKRVQLDKPVAQETLNRSFEFPLTDAQGKEVSKLKYEIQNAELRNEIIVKGQRAMAVKGRVFLILNIKITNSYQQSLELKSRDYVRLIVAGSPEKLAAEIHNDPVDVQAISTKYTRLGFPIDENKKDLTLQIGEINGAKQTVKLNLQ